MRDFRDAKTMAQTLRETLTTKAVIISHSESLEMVSRMLGVADWNTLSAMLQSTRRDTAAPAGKRPREANSYPAIPLRDFDSPAWPSGAPLVSLAAWPGPVDEPSTTSLKQVDASLASAFGMSMPTERNK